MLCFVCSLLPVLLCSFSLSCAFACACLYPVFSFLFPALCQSIELNCCLIEPTVLRGWEGFAAPKQACWRCGAWRREVMFMHLMRGSSCLLSTKICSVLDMKSHLSHQHILNQLETAVLYSTYSMRQLEAHGSSLLLKLRRIHELEQHDNFTA